MNNNENSVIDLGGSAWTLTGVWPYATDLNQSIERGLPFHGVTDTILASVPGSVYQDLKIAGLIEDPYVGMNSLRCEWVENKWWIYERDFAAPLLSVDERLLLWFEGLDYHSRVYLGTKLLARHDSMFLPLVLDITDLINRSDTNHLTVLFEETPREIALGYSSRVTTQKPRFAYKWDFSTRLVNVGIWNDVFLKREGPCTLSDVRVRTDFKDGEGLVDIEARLQCASDLSSVHVEVRLLDPQGATVGFERLAGAEEVICCIRLAMPAVWYPAGHGAHPLYRVLVSAHVRGTQSDDFEAEVGIRHLEYRKNPGAPAEALPYTIVMNGCPVYIHGVNLTPFDHLYGCVTDDDYRTYVRLLVEARVNLVRIWGGGLIEKEIFYRLCDRSGIMIWQEFLQTGSGIENVPPSDELYLDLLALHAEWAVKARRNYVSLVIWCGGNELRGLPLQDTPADVRHPNLALLERIVRTHDDQRLFLPTSASGPFEFVTEPGGHDVHGQWRYGGTTEHYAIYNASDALFHSEFGVDGMASEPLVRYVTGEGSPPVQSTESNSLWRFHAEWWDNLTQNQALFGPFMTLRQYIACSQLMQGEGLRYIIEADRRRAPHNSGSIVWQFNEPWPNLSCTSLVDHLRIPKGGYYFLSRAYANINVSLYYRTICPAVGTVEEYRIFLSTFGEVPTEPALIGYEILDIHGVRIATESKVMSLMVDKVIEVFRFELRIPDTKEGLFFIRSFHLVTGCPRTDNTYFFSTAREPAFAHMTSTTCRLTMVRSGRDIHMMNVGETAALFLHPLFEKGNAILDDAWFCLFPNEGRTVRIISEEEVDVTMVAVNPVEFRLSSGR